jgi:hypothetical protein
MMFIQSSTVASAPSLFIQSKGEDSTVVGLRLTNAPERMIVRFTGGCGCMTAEYAEGLYDLFVSAFKGFRGGMLFGGTRMIKRDNPSEIVPGITEIPPLIRQDNPESVILGVIPNSEDLKFAPEGLIVSAEKGNDFITIAHPNQDTCLLLQESVDRKVSWESEFEECLRITENLRSFAHWGSLLISYNGGGVTEKEIVATAQRGWPVLLIRGSGRITDVYAADQNFLQQFPNVSVADANVASLRSQLVRFGVLRGTAPLALVSPSAQRSGTTG